MNGVGSSALRWSGMALAPLVLAGLTWALVRPHEHQGEYYVARGHASGTLRADTHHRACIYVSELGVAKIPVAINIHGDGAVTFHTTATVSQHGRLLASVETDYPAQSTGGLDLNYVAVPVAQDQFDGAGALTCGVTSTTSTPGAWFPNDD
jgi:hypothetical protein